jgi:hypothetical protein
MVISGQREYDLCHFKHREFDIWKSKHLDAFGQGGSRKRKRIKIF